VVLAPTPTQTPDAAATLRRGAAVVWAGIKGEPRWFTVAVVGSVLYGVMTVGSAWAVGKVFREIVTPAVAAHTVTPGQLATAGAWIAGVVVLNTIGVLGRRLAAARVMYNLGATYRRAVTRQYVTLPLSWHHRHPSGELLSNANADVEATWNVFAPLPMALGVVVMLVVAGVQMVLIDPWVALVGLVVFPALFGANAVFQRYMSPLVTRAQQLRADVSEVAHESFEAALVVKTLGREDEESARFAQVSDQLRAANVAVGRTRGIFDPVIEALPVAGTLVVLAVGAQRVAGGRMTPAEVIQIAYLFSVLSFPVRAFGWVLGDLPRSIVGWDRVQAVLQARGVMAYGDRHLEPGRPLGLAVEGVSFAYDVTDDDGRPARYPVLRDVTFTIAPGRTVAVVGATGSGKSTLVDLVVRLVDPEAGTVRYDGIDVRELARDELPRSAALVAQSAFVFDDTVRGNVTLGLAVGDDEVWAALDVAAASDFIHALPGGLDTRVGERGTSLSGGQRQRLALARAVLRRPRLLVLDDATSAVDPTVEQAIFARVREASGGMTVLVVAHRLATIAAADEVLFLSDGRVVDHGSHEDLTRRSSGYREIVQAYADDAVDRATGADMVR
jgi:ABC-type multidrug transport system fused ATPase/permease subunit